MTSMTDFMGSISRKPIQYSSLVSHVDEKPDSLHERMREIFQKNYFWIDINIRNHTYQLTFQAKYPEVDTQLSSIRELFPTIPSDLLNLSKMEMWQKRRAVLDPSQTEVVLTFVALKEMINAKTDKPAELGRHLESLAQQTKRVKIQRFTEEIDTFLSTMRLGGNPNWRIDINDNGHPQVKFFVDSNDHVDDLKKAVCSYLDRNRPTYRAIDDRRDLITKSDEGEKILSRHQWRPEYLEEGQVMDHSLTLSCSATMMLVDDCHGGYHSQTALQSMHNHMIDAELKKAERILAKITNEIFGAEYIIVINRYRHYALEFITYTEKDRELLIENIVKESGKLVTVDQKWQKLENKLRELEGEPKTEYTFALSSSDTMALLGLRMQTAKNFDEVMEKLSGLKKPERGIPEPGISLKPMQQSHDIGGKRIWEENVFAYLKQSARRPLWYKQAEGDRINIYRTTTGHQIWSIKFEYLNFVNKIETTVEVNGDRTQYDKWDNAWEINSAYALLIGNWEV